MSGKCFVITGGASGLGEATVRALFDAGHDVAVFDRDDASELISELNCNARGNKATSYEVDVTDYESVKKAVDGAVSAHGALNGCINSAGVGSASLTVGRGNEPHNPDIFDFVTKVNLYGTFNVSSLVAAAMSKLPAGDDNTRGVIINVASVAALEGQKGQLAYSASKGAVVGMTLPMARDLARYGIRVMCIAPGIMDTPMMAMASQKVRDGLVRGVPVKRFGTPEEFASLCCEIVNNGYLNGELVRLGKFLFFSSDRLFLTTN